MIFAEGKKLGHVDDREFTEVVRRSERAFDEAGLFVLETETTFTVIDRFDTVEEMKQRRWMGSRLPDELALRIESAPPPLDSHTRLTLRRFRAR